MRTENIQPRRQLLEIWNAVAAYTMDQKKWRWGGLHEANSISDAEQLLCLLQPATTLAELRLEVPDGTAEDVLRALKPFGDSVQIPRAITNAIDQYLTTYTLPDGTPLFSGGSYFSPVDPDATLTKEQRETDVVVSCAMSVTLCLAALGFLQNYANSATKGAWHNRVLEIRARVSGRLTAALVGLLRGWAMNPVEIDSAEGRNLMTLLGLDGLPERRVAELFNNRMETVRSRLSEARLGVARADELDNDNLLFDIGWTWGVANNAPHIALDESGQAIGSQRDGVALPAPYLYFTLIALDAIEQLTGDRTRVLGLLDAQQERLAGALSIRRELTQLYWSRLARFNRDSWPLEDLPWRTLDGAESDYFTLLVTAVLIQDLRQRNANEDDLLRVTPLLAELANRSRITRRPLRNDAMLALHSPGLLNTLDGAEKLGPLMGWRIADFAPLLLKRVEQLAQLTTSAQARDDLLTLGTQVWQHLKRRQIAVGQAKGLWDDPGLVFPTLEATQTEPVWYLTSRVVDALVTAATTQTVRQTRDAGLSSTASAMVSEAEYLLNIQQMSTPSVNSPLQYALQQIRESLERARSLIDQQPSTAIALSLDAVTQLDKNMQARLEGGQGL
jgi:hypothetical protein